MKTYFARPRLLSQLFKHRRVDWTKQAVKVFGEAG